MLLAEEEGDSVSTDRLSSAVTPGMAQRKHWYFNLCGCTLVCAQMGVFVKSKGLGLLDKVSLPAAPKSDAPTRRGGALRAACAIVVV